MFAKVLVILASISAVLAYPEIIEPINSTVFQAGNPSTIHWRDNGTAPTLAQFGNCSISIYVGTISQQTRLQQLTPRINATVGEFTFTPDATIGPNSGEYFIRMESSGLMIGAYPAMVFSARFNMTGMRGTFSPAVLSQLNGQSSTSGPSSTGGGLTTRLASTPATTATNRPSSAAPSATNSASSAESIIFHGSWLGFLISTLLGVML